MSTYEENKNANNIISKVFNEYSNSFGTVKIYGTDENPLFDTQQVGACLELQRFGRTVKDKYKNPRDYVDGRVFITGQHRFKKLLTRRGVLRAMFSSNTKAAEIFRDFIDNILMQLQRTGEAKLQKAIDDINNELETAKEHNQNLIDDIADCHVKMNISNEQTRELVKYKNYSDCDNTPISETHALKKICDLSTDEMCIYVMGPKKEAKRRKNKSKKQVAIEEDSSDDDDPMEVQQFASEMTARDYNFDYDSLTEYDPYFDHDTVCNLYLAKYKKIKSAVLMCKIPIIKGKYKHFNKLKKALRLFKFSKTRNVYACSISNIVSVNNEIIMSL